MTKALGYLVTDSTSTFTFFIIISVHESLNIVLIRVFCLRWDVIRRYSTIPYMPEWAIGHYPFNSVGIRAALTHWLVSRACTSVESAGIAGASHLVNFVCTDTVAALGTHSTPSSPDTRVPDTNNVTSEPSLWGAWDRCNFFFKSWHSIKYK